MNWKFWRNEETEEQKQIRLLEARVKQLEDDTRVFYHYETQGDPVRSLYARCGYPYPSDIETGRPKVGEAVKHLLEHLSLRFEKEETTSRPARFVSSANAVVEAPPAKKKAKK